MDWAAGCAPQSRGFLDLVTMPHVVLAHWSFFLTTPSLIVESTMYFYLLFVFYQYQYYLNLNSFLEFSWGCSKWDVSFFFHFCMHAFNPRKNLSLCFLPFRLCDLGVYSFLKHSYYIFFLEHFFCELKGIRFATRFLNHFNDLVRSHSHLLY